VSDRGTVSGAMSGTVSGFETAETSTTRLSLRWDISRPSRLEDDLDPPT
jgi:hypothetical protein